MAKKQEEERKQEQTVAQPEEQTAQQETAGTVPEAEAAPDAAEQETKSANEPAPKSELELQKEQNAALNDRLLRLMAEYDNYKKRTQREKDSIFPEATATAVAKFLPVIDDFERAMEMECSDAAFKEGVGMIQKSFFTILEKFSVEEIGKVGETFDPNFHNAVMHIEDDSKGEGEVVQVFQKGYKIGDRVLRYAMVQVAN